MRKQINLPTLIVAWSLDVGGSMCPYDCEREIRSVVRTVSSDPPEQAWWALDLDTEGKGD